MTSSHHGPHGVGYKRATMVDTKGWKLARVSESQKTDRSPDRSLQLDSLKSESLVIANQNVAVNTCLLYTSPSPRDATLSRMPSSA